MRSDTAEENLLEVICPETKQKRILVSRSATLLTSRSTYSAAASYSPQPGCAIITDSHMNTSTLRLSVEGNTISRRRRLIAMNTKAERHETPTPPSWMTLKSSNGSKGYTARLLVLFVSMYAYSHKPHEHLHHVIRKPKIQTLIYPCLSPLPSLLKNNKHEF